MASNLQNGEGRAMTMERFAQLTKAGLPFNPLANAEVTGANLKRLQDAAKTFEWSDPRFIDADQAEAMGWSITENAMRVETLVRDEMSGGVKTVALYNAAFVPNMPSLDAFLAMSGDELAAMRGSPNAMATFVPRADTTELDEEVFSIGPARTIERMLTEPPAQVVAPVQDVESAEQHVGKDQLSEEAPANAVETNPAMPHTPSEIQQGPERFAVLAPYWRQGLHNVEGLALAEEINKTIIERKLEEDREAIARLMTVHENAQRLGLSIVPEELYRNDPSLLANAAEPRTLLGGALVRDPKGAYRPAAGGRVVLQDNGDTVSLKSKSAEGYQAAMELAIAKGWTAIELKGKPAMLADAWLEAKLKGLDVVNYSPTKQDIEKYTDRLAAEKARAQPVPAPLETTPEHVEVRPFVDAQGHAKTATVVYTVSQTGSEPQTFESARAAAKAFASAPAIAAPMVVRTVTHVDGDAREDVVAAVGNPSAGAQAAIETVLDEEFELAMLDEIAQSKTASLSLGPKDEPATRHIGEILEVQGDKLVQSIGRGKTIMHDIANLDGPLPAIGAIADIQYKNGIGRVRGPEPTHELGASR